jgi:hypothetical protein
MPLRRRGALACELPCRRGLPLSRWSVAELRQVAVASGIVAQISGTTLWRWLGQDAPRPRRHRTWIFPRDPQFARKAGQVLDLYQRRWKNAVLGSRDYVLSTDEKTSIQARRRKHPPLPPAPGRPLRVEHEYARAGAWAYLAAPAFAGTSLGRAPRQAVRPLRAQERDRGVRAPGRSGHGSGTLSFGAACVLRRGQRFLPSRPASRRATAGQLAEYHSGPHADPRQLALIRFAAQADRDLLLHCSAQASHTERLRRPGDPQTRSDGLPKTLSTLRQTIQMDLYAPRPARPSRQAQVS